MEGRAAWRFARICAEDCETEPILMELEVQLRLRRGSRGEEIEKCSRAGALVLVEICRRDGSLELPFQVFASHTNGYGLSMTLKFSNHASYK